MIDPAAPLLLLGAGKMGGALLAGWLDSGVPPHAVVVIDPSPSPEMARFLDAQGVRHETAVPMGLTPRACVVAVKPQMMAAALPALRPGLTAETLIISIAAGTRIAAFEAALGPRPVIRAMPNTPAQVGRGVTVCVANAGTTEDDRDLTNALLGAVGSVDWVEDEALIDAVTAVSGSGPAYVFLLVECLAKAAEAEGLPADIAMRIARGTVAGAGELLARSDLDAATLRVNVTSPGGTTAAALAVLGADDGMPRLLREGVAAAARRSRELAAG